MPRRRGVRRSLLRAGTGLRRVAEAGLGRPLRWGLLAAVSIVILAVAWPHSAAAQRAVLDAILEVESGGRDDCADGDGGRAIGPYQIHRGYWQDAVAADPALGPAAGFDYQDCRRRTYAEAVVRAYMRRWVPEAWRRGDAETIARTHNGGPRGRHKPATDGYWQRVRRHLR